MRRMAVSRTHTEIRVRTYFQPEPISNVFAFRRSSMVIDHHEVPYLAHWMAVRKKKTETVVDVPQTAQKVLPQSRASNSGQARRSERCGEEAPEGWSLAYSSDCLSVRHFLLVNGWTRARALACVLVYGGGGRGERRRQTARRLINMPNAERKRAGPPSLPSLPCRRPRPHSAPCLGKKVPKCDASCVPLAA